MDPSKIEARIDKIPRQRLKDPALSWKWKVIPTNEVVRHEDGTPWIQDKGFQYKPKNGEIQAPAVVNPNAYFEGRRGHCATYSEAKAAMDARVAEVLAMPDTDGVNPDEDATVYTPDSF